MTAAGTLAEAMHSAGSAKQNEAAKLEKLKAFTHKKAAGCPAAFAVSGVSTVYLKDR